MSEPLLRVRHLVKHFEHRHGFFSRKPPSVLRAVDDVSFEVPKGKTLGLVGETGCGKSTTARCILRLLDPNSGEVFFEGEDILKYDRERLRTWRRQAQIIFQDPYASLDPRMTAFDIIAEPLRVHGSYGEKGGRRWVLQLLEMVGLNPDHARRYPHEFSGGQRQRVSIARALALHPKLIVCDEPVSALDVSIRSQIVNLLRDLQGQLGLTYLFIAHDLSLVRLFCDDVAVMYLGRIIELSDRHALYRRPHHPYSQSLLSAIPIPDPHKEAVRKRILLQGEVPSPIDPPSGCTFHPRCFKAQAVCSTKTPGLDEVEADHRAACFFAAPAKVV